jgi:hypothetical protein
VIANSNGNAISNGIAVIENLFSYTPNTEGGIISITATVDKYSVFTGAGTITNSFKPLLEQDGNYYYAQISKGGPVAFTNGHTFPFTTITDALPLTSSSFFLYDFTTGTMNLALHPNFSGDTIQFGLLALGGNPAATVSYDNLGFTLTTTPLPSTWLMLLSGFVGLGYFAYRGTKKNAALAAA